MTPIFNIHEGTDQATLYAFTQVILSEKQDAVKFHEAQSAAAMATVQHYQEQLCGAKKQIEALQASKTEVTEELLALMDARVEEIKVELTKAQQAEKIANDTTEQAHRDVAMAKEDAERARRDAADARKIDRSKEQRLRGLDMGGRILVLGGTGLGAGLALSLGAAPALVGTTVVTTAAKFGVAQATLVAASVATGKIGAGIQTVGWGIQAFGAKCWWGPEDTANRYDWTVDHAKWAWAGTKAAAQTATSRTAGIVLFLPKAIRDWYRARKRANAAVASPDPAETQVLSTTESVSEPQLSPARLTVTV